MASNRIGLSADQIAPAFPGADVRNIRYFWPFVRDALADRNLTSPVIVAYALATVAAETAGFVPLEERRSKYNTRAAPFDLYENRADLGNDLPGDGARFKGRGFIQLTGRDNYRLYGDRIDIPLVVIPERANDADIAAALLAEFIADREAAILIALRDGNLAGARKLVNGGTHGIERFRRTYQRVLGILNLP